MAQHQVNIVSRQGIFYGKSKSGLITARPFLLFECGIFFKYTDGVAGRHQETARSNKKNNGFPGCVHWTKIIQEMKNA